MTNLQAPPTMRTPSEDGTEAVGIWVTLAASVALVVLPALLVALAFGQYLGSLGVGQ